MSTRPSFFIAAAPRSGTTSLYNYLGQHPEVALSRQKEPAFYHFRVPQPDFDDLAARYGQGDKAASIRRYRSSLNRATTDLAAYERLWAHKPNAAMRGDATPTYLYHREALGLMRDEVPEAKIILLLRDPVDRAYSQYLQYLRHGIETDYSFESAVNREPVGVREYWWGERRYLRLGLYADHVESCISLFGPDNVLILLSEEFEFQPVSVVNRAAVFLGLDPLDELDDSVRHNRAFVPVPTLAVHAVRSRGALKRIVGRVIPASMRSRLYHTIMSRRVMTPPPLHSATRARLNEFYAGEVERLSRLTDADLGMWLRS